jgi:hypothetical protein
MRPSAIISGPAEPGSAVTDRIRQQLAPVLDAITIESGNSVRFADLDPVSIPSSEQAPPTAAAAATHPLVEPLAQLIYNLAYARPLHTGARLFLDHGQKLPKIMETDAEFLSRLSAANCSRERWDSMWRVYELRENGGLSVEKRSTNRLVLAGQFIFNQTVARAPAIGENVSVYAPKESIGTQAGFYFAFGETISSDYDDAHLSRFYFNMNPDRVPWLIERLSVLLNRHRIAYRLKCLANPLFYERMDPVVLYVAKRFVPAFMRLFAGARNELADRLRDGTPLLTKPMLNGMGAADEPGGGFSFGQSRSRLLSEGVVDAWLAGDQSSNSRLWHISRRFRRSGLSLASPHLSEGAKDLYEWPSEDE